MYRRRVLGATLSEAGRVREAPEFPPSLERLITAPCKSMTSTTENTTSHGTALRRRGPKRTARSFMDMPDPAPGSTRHRAMLFGIAQSSSRNGGQPLQRWASTAAASADTPCLLMQQWSQTVIGNCIHLHRRGMGERRDRRRGGGGLAAPERAQVTCCQAIFSRTNGLAALHSCTFRSSQSLG